MDSETIEASAAEWVIRRSGETWSETDQERLDSWLSESTLHRVAYLRLEAVWQKTARLKALGAGRPPGVVPPHGTWRTLQSLSTSIDTDRLWLRAPSFKRRAAMAASMLLILLAGFYWGFAHMRGGPHEYATAVGGLQVVRLGDGSEVTLNTNTHIRVELGSRARRIELDSGEAYFVVAKDPSRPFVVTVADHKVMAVGTQFAVRRSPSGAQVLVIQGRVELRLSGAGTAEAPLTLEAGTLARTFNGDVMVERITKAEAELLLSWRSGFVVFHETSLADAAAEINRYLPRKLVLEDPSVGSIKLSGKFRTDNLDAFLSLLQRGFPVSVEETPDRIMLKRRP